MRWGSAEKQHKDSDCAETHALCLNDKNGFVCHLFFSPPPRSNRDGFSTMHALYTMLITLK